MVQRDYVRKKSRSKKNNSRNKPNLMIFLAIIIIILFSTILYYIVNNKPTQSVKPPKVKTQPPAITLPERPQERWTYLKELETPNASYGSRSIASERQQILDSFVNNSRPVAPTKNNNVTKQEIPTSTTTQDFSTSNKWILKCGAFKDKANAETLKARIAMIGISGNVSSGQLYRVTAGQYTNKNEANKALNSLKNNGINDCIISN
ncbi:SPOR domain-containing protein [Gilliamella sp. B2776]|uniref:SPOR domain-containing protein n=2 Tax=Gilliamella TaxID=1193503 RepID=UPI00226A9D01|nr:MULTISPECIES: SPOR domain-containing protein [unclassified Gilliamella]MCX8654663.1 SPOR domain-containing protein [Gilliamella sp. B2737]MCX8650364.1 SPOR domain-containing protein [Gilliamella sp. B2779]MCX8656704.1 SPOR domain-containing protein [Gilliamella sp. B2894]MCX8692137.1 SPOR domain-containing protein [Gilliamella sp. B2776]MCX8694324.1 SPOR domain-containing protein [Gilliamella sp. B2881]